MQRRNLLLSRLAGFASARTAFAADDFPNRPVKVIMPFAAGGGPDVQMRQLAPKFGEALGQAVVVDNKFAKNHQSDFRRSNRDQTETPNSTSKSLTYDVLM